MPSTKHMLVIAAIALAVLYAANNVSAIGKLVAPKA
jgi:hypothetical protein